MILDYAKLHLGIMIAAATCQLHCIALHIKRSRCMLPPEPDRPKYVHSRLSRHRPMLPRAVNCARDMLASSYNVACSTSRREYLPLQTPFALDEILLGQCLAGDLSR